MVSFRKQEDCPTSQELLAFQLGDLEPLSSRNIARHLAVCEFCTAEADFYERYPISRDVDDSPDSESSMPEPLFELAEALLNRKRGQQSMDEMLRELDAALHDRR